MTGGVFDWARECPEWAPMPSVTVVAYVGQLKAMYPQPIPRQRVSR